MIYAQRVDASGAALWAANGVAVCPASSLQGEPAIIPDGAGGAVLVWGDKRNGNYDIYAQRVDASGALQWGDGGAGICTAANDEYSPQMVSDGSGGAIIAYEFHGPNYDEYDIYAQRVDGDGAIAWAPAGVVVCAAPMHQSDPQPVSDDVGGALVAWYDERSGDPDIYAARIDALGMHVATALQDYGAYVDGSVIAIHWTLSGVGAGARHCISRARGTQGAFIELDAPVITCEYSYFTAYDERCEPGISYRYRVEIEDEDGRGLLFETAPLSVPLRAVTLGQNCPNPFNPSTVIRYYLPERGRVVLDVYDTSGRRVVRLVDGERDKGIHHADWSGADARGIPVASGVYFYRLSAGKETISRKMILMRCRCAL